MAGNTRSPARSIADFNLIRDGDKSPARRFLQYLSAKGVDVGVFQPREDASETAWTAFSLRLNNNDDTAWDDLFWYCTSLSLNTYVILLDGLARSTDTSRSTAMRMHELIRSTWAMDAGAAADAPELQVLAVRHVTNEQARSAIGNEFEAAVSAGLMSPATSSMTVATDSPYWNDNPYHRVAMGVAGRGQSRVTPFLKREARDEERDEDGDVHMRIELQVAADQAAADPVAQADAANREAEDRRLRREARRRAKAKRRTEEARAAEEEERFEADLLERERRESEVRETERIASEAQREAQRAAEAQRTENQSSEERRRVEAEQAEAKRREDTRRTEQDRLADETRRAETELAAEKARRLEAERVQAEQVEATRRETAKKAKQEQDRRREAERLDSRTQQALTEIRRLGDITRQLVAAHTRLRVLSAEAPFDADALFAVRQAYLTIAPAWAAVHHQIDKETQRLEKLARNKKIADKAIEALEAIRAEDARQRHLDQDTARDAKAQIDQAIKARAKKDLDARTKQQQEDGDGDAVDASERSRRLSTKDKNARLEELKGQIPQLTAAADPTARESMEQALLEVAQREVLWLVNVYESDTPLSITAQEVDELTMSRRRRRREARKKKKEKKKT